MIPTFWLTIRVGRKRIPLPLPLILPLTLAAEILAILPTAIYAIWKKETLPLKIVSGFYLSRFMFVLILRGRAFGVNVCEGGNKVQIAGRWLRKLPVG